MGTICVLLISSILVYVTAMLAIPFTYQKNVSVQFENNSAEFSQKLNKWTVNEAEDRIYNFCIDNGVIEQLNSGDGQTFTFGDIEKIKEKVMTTIIEPFNAIAANIGVMEVIKYFTNYADCKVINKSLLLNLVDMTIELLNYNNISEGE